MTDAIIWLHLLAAILAIGLGLLNLLLVKGTLRHRIFGWVWISIMLTVSVPSFWIRELNNGDLSWIHLLTAWTIMSMTLAIIAIRTGKVRLHANFMIGTLIGATIAGGFALVPGRFISKLLGYG